MITVQTHPSLALIKYWGKSHLDENLPATSSLAISLQELYTETRISKSSEGDTVQVDGILMPPERYAPFFERIRNKFSVNIHFQIKSRSNFPSAAGLASSSSGFASLAYGCAKLIDPNADVSLISDLARLGSASAARAVFEGFTILKKNSSHAEPLFDKNYWPELRIIIGIVKGEPKKVSSRNAMEQTRQTSPFYPSWLKESDKTFELALQACKEKNLNTLGPLITQSYLMMFSTMFTSQPPIFFWEPLSIALIKECENFREKGYSIWETMDAGPQVKMLCIESECNHILQQLKTKFPEVDFLLSKIGGGPRVLES